MKNRGAQECKIVKTKAQKLRWKKDHESTSVRGPRRPEKHNISWWFNYRFFFCQVFSIKLQNIVFIQISSPISFLDAFFPNKISTFFLFHKIKHFLTHYDSIVKTIFRILIYVVHDPKCNAICDSVLQGMQQICILLPFEMWRKKVQNQQWVVIINLKLN
jgi:hypothetical protein